MLARVTELYYWKAESSLQNCQDQFLYNAGEGLFVVADGAGTSSFPRLWAEVLVEQFLSVPLLSADPFEVAWWVLLAQERYIRRRPNLDQLPFVAREKEETKGSESTLAVLRVSQAGADSASAELLAFGDSCVLIGRQATQQVESFPLVEPEEFAHRPVCVPSHPGVFSRKFHRCSVKADVSLTPQDVVVIATDAVAKWVIGGGDARSSSWEAFQEIAQQTPGRWNAFIDEQRARRAIADDDSTALVIELRPDSAQEASQGQGSAAAGWVPLGMTTRHRDEVVQARKAQFEQARSEQQRELEAIYYGDGTDLRGVLTVEYTQDDMRHARDVADALRVVISAAAANYNKPDFVAKMQKVWAEQNGLLEEERCAKTIRETLRAKGVFESAPQGGAQAGPPEAGSTLQQATSAPAALQPLPASSPPSIVIRPSAAAPGSPAGLSPLSPLSASAPAFFPSPGLRAPDGRERWEAVITLRTALESQHLRMVALAFRRVKALDALTDLMPQEAELGNHALRLAEALEGGDASLLLSAYDRLVASGHERAFQLTAEERQKILQAQVPMQAQVDPATPLVSSGPVVITAGELEQAKRVKHYYLKYWIGVYEQRLNATPADEAELRHGLERCWAELNDAQLLHGQTLDELVDDVFLREVFGGAQGLVSYTPEIAELDGFLEKALAQEPGGLSGFWEAAHLSRELVWEIFKLFIRRMKLRKKFGSKDFAAFLEQRRAEVGLPASFSVPPFR